MNLIEFNAENTMKLRTGRPTLSVNTKTGVFSLNRHATELVGVDPGDQIVLLQDEDEPGNWYVEKVTEGGFLLRGKVEAGGVCTNHSSLARQMFSCLGITDQSTRFIMAGEPTVFGKRKLWGLISPD